MTMQRYQCRAEVEAAKIASVREGFDANTFSFFITLEDGEELDVGREFDERWNPKPGDYYVVSHAYGVNACLPASAIEADFTKAD